MTQLNGRSRSGTARSALLCSMLGIGLALGGNATAQDSALEDIVETGKSRLAENREFQQRINELDEDIREKVEAYRSVNKEIEGLEVYLGQLGRQVDSQEQQEMADLEQSIEEVTLIKRQITPLMLKMVDGLEQFVNLDLPFLEDQTRQPCG